MAEIRPIKDLRNTTEISQLCHEKMKRFILQKMVMAI